MSASVPSPRLRYCFGCQLGVFSSARLVCARRGVRRSRQPRAGGASCVRQQHDERGVTLGRASALRARSGRFEPGAETRPGCAHLRSHCGRGVSSSASSGSDTQERRKSARRLRRRQRRSGHCRPKRNPGRGGLHARKSSATHLAAAHDPAGENVLSPSRVQRSASQALGSAILSVKSMPLYACPGRAAWKPLQTLPT